MTQSKYLLAINLKIPCHLLHISFIAKKWYMQIIPKMCLNYTPKQLEFIWLIELIKLNRIWSSHLLAFPVSQLPSLQAFQPFSLCFPPFTSPIPHSDFDIASQPTLLLNFPSSHLLPNISCRLPSAFPIPTLTLSPHFPTFSPSHHLPYVPCTLVLFV